jgi:hypothetical protein
VVRNSCFFAVFLLFKIQQEQVDVVDQKDKKKSSSSSSLDMTRIAQVAITGFVWSRPSTHTWYAILERIATIQDPILGLIAHIILDALIYSPFTVSGYFVVQSILEGDGWWSIQEKLRTKFFGTEDQGKCVRIPFCPVGHHAALNYFFGRTMKQTVSQVRDGWYGNHWDLAVGHSDQKEGVNCNKLFQTSLNFAATKFIPLCDEISGTIKTLVVDADYI